MKSINRREFVKRTVSIGMAAAAMPLLQRCSFEENTRRPNIIIVFCDDLGYGDLSSFGHPTIRTPNLDKMAAEGQKWTSFYVPASVCTPSRAGLMTGRYPVRNGMCSDKYAVLFEDSMGGLPESEITIARSLKKAGYTTGCIGKWHLGHHSQYLPTSHGFDSYYGIPYSNDMARSRKIPWEEWMEMNLKSGEFNVPLMRNEEIIEQPVDQNTLTKRYNEAAVKYIKDHKEEPFFLYLAHNLPHVPLFTSDEFRGSSPRGLYGDVVEEIDSGVGKVLSTLKQEGLDENTLVVFTSDNGPWLRFKEHGGSAGPLRGGKGMTWEGGMREPTIFWWPDKIKSGIVTDLGSTLDLFATICSITGAKLPNDRVMDSYDLTPVLFQESDSPRQLFFYYKGTELYAARKGKYKAHFITRSLEKKEYHDPPLLYNIEHDPGEQYDIAEEYPDIIEEIRKEVEAHQANLIRGKDQLAERLKNHNK